MPQTDGQTILLLAGQIKLSATPRFENRGQDLHQRLLHEAVEYSGNSQLPETAPGLWDFSPQHGLRPVAAREQLLSNFMPMATEKLAEVIDGHPVEARCSSIALYS